MEIYSETGFSLSLWIVKNDFQVLRIFCIERLQAGQLSLKDIQVTPSRGNILNLNVKWVPLSSQPPTSMATSSSEPDSKLLTFWFQEEISFEFFSQSNEQLDSSTMQTNISSMNRWLRNVISELQKYLLVQKAYLCSIDPCNQH